MSRIEDLEGRLAKDPSSKIFGQLAEEYRKAGRLEDAIKTCRDGLENHPNYFSARVALGRALLESNDLEEAGREFESVLAQVPDNILANKFLGQTYEQLGRLDDAVAKYRIAQMLAPEDRELAEVVQRLEAQLDGVSASSNAPPPPPPPVYDDPTAIEMPEEVETKAVPMVEVEDSQVVEPTLLEEPPAVEREPLLEPTLTEDSPSQGGAPAQEQVAEPQREQVFEPEREQVFEFEETPQEEPQAPSQMAGPEAPEIDSAPPVSDEARAIQEEIEQSFPTDVMQRQLREIMESSEGPVPSETDTKGPFEAPAPPLATEPEPLVIEPTPPELVEHGTTQSMGIESPPSMDSVASVPPPAATPAVPETPESPGTPTTTLAELYASQGHLDQALGVYRDILAREPDNDKVRQRVEELTMLVHAQTEAGPGTPSRGTIAGSDGRALDETIRMLEGWLAAIRKA
jgi:tetratricopeptide (TPR) repeat protein